MMGVAYSFLVSSLWPAVPVVVEGLSKVSGFGCGGTDALGLAFGVVTALQNFGLATLPLIAGTVLDAHTQGARTASSILTPSLEGYHCVILMFATSAAVALAGAVALWVCDARRWASCGSSASRRWVGILSSDPTTREALLQGCVVGHTHAGMGHANAYDSLSSQFQLNDPLNHRRSSPGSTNGCWGASCCDVLPFHHACRDGSNRSQRGDACVEMAINCCSSRNIVFLYCCRSFDRQSNEHCSENNHNSQGIAASLSQRQPLKREFCSRFKTFAVLTCVLTYAFVNHRYSSLEHRANGNRSVFGDADSFVIKNDTTLATFRKSNS